MKVLVVSQYYPPEPVGIPADVAEGLAARGHRVRVLTGFPSYPQGAVYPGYRQSWRDRGRVNGVDVCRVPTFVDHSERPAARMASYASFGASAATARRFARGADVIYVYATQMTAALAPWLWRIVRGAPYVLHVQDLWPDSITGSSLVRSGLATKSISAILNPWLASVYRRAGAVVGIAPGMVAALAERGVPDDLLQLVYNWARTPAVLSSSASADSSRIGTVAIYAGNVGDMQDLETVVLAAHRMKDRALSVRIVGNGVALPRVRELSDRLGATNIQFFERVPPDQMQALYADADYSLVTLKNLPAFEGTIPSKLQASFANGLPVITTVRGDVRSIVERHGVGFTAEPEDVGSLEHAFATAIDQNRHEREAMKQRAAALHAREFSESAALDRIEEILKDVVNRTVREA